MKYHKLYVLFIASLLGFVSACSAAVDDPATGTDNNRSSIQDAYYQTCVQQGLSSGRCGQPGLDTLSELGRIACEQETEAECKIFATAMYDLGWKFAAAGPSLEACGRQADRGEQLSADCENILMDIALVPAGTWSKQVISVAVGAVAVAALIYWALPLATRNALRTHLATQGSSEHVVGDVGQHTEEEARAAVQAEAARDYNYNYKIQKHEYKYAQVVVYPDGFRVGGLFPTLESCKKQITSVFMRVGETKALGGFCVPLPL